MKTITEIIKDAYLKGGNDAQNNGLLKITSAEQAAMYATEVVNKNDLLPDISQQSEPFINFTKKVIKYYEEMDIGDYDLYKEAKKLINGG